MAVLHLPRLRSIHHRRSLLVSHCLARLDDFGQDVLPTVVDPSLPAAVPQGIAVVPGSVSLFVRTAFTAMHVLRADPHRPRHDIT